MTRIRADLFIAAALFGFTLLFYWPAVHFPPRNDHWIAFYIFDQMGGGLQAVGKIAAYFLWGHLRFQPLSHLLLYFSDSLFHEAFHFHNLIHIALYAGIIAQFYALLRFAAVPQLVSALSALLCAVLYSHFDIASWSYHTYILAAVSCVLGAVPLLARFYSRGERWPLFAACALLLTAMYCYEAFDAVPLIVLGAFGFANRGQADPNARLKWGAAGIYALYIATFLVYLSFVSDRPSQYGWRAFVSPGHLLSALKITFTNLSYVNLCVNFFPWLGYPPGLIVNALVTLNPMYEGLVVKLENAWPATALALAALWGAALRFAFPAAGALAKRVAFVALTLALLSYLGILVGGRSLTDKSMYIYVEYRYQFFPNLILMAMLGLVLSKWLSGEMRAWKRGAVAAGFSLLIAAHATLTRRTLGDIAKLQGEHRALIDHIKAAIRDGRVSESSKLYIDPELIENRRMWNPRLGQFPGTIEWLFKDSPKYFALDAREASVFVDEGLALTQSRNSLTKSR